MANVKRKSTGKLTGSDAKKLRNAVLYIANLKRWLKKEQQWQVRMRRDFIMLRRKVDPGPPGYPPPPPPPPYRP